MLLGLMLIVPTILLLVMKGLTSNLEGGHSYRIWTDNTGQFSARARLKTDYGNSVVLERKADGEFVTVPVDRLSPRDRDFLISGEAAGGRFEDRENEVFEMFPFSLGRWDFSSPRDF